MKTGLELFGLVRSVVWIVSTRQTGTFIAEEAFRGQAVSAILEDSQGILWVGTWAGVARREQAPQASHFYQSLEGVTCDQ